LYRSTEGQVKLAFSNAIVGSIGPKKGAKGRQSIVENKVKRQTAQEVLAPFSTVNFPVLAYVSEDPMRN